MNPIEVKSMPRFDQENNRDTEGNASYESEERLDDGNGDSRRPSGARGRSMSVATAQPSVETVVVKAKRAAKTLWILLHAQNCLNASSCPNPGCKEAKRLHLHLKTCPAVSESESALCPSGYNGCQQARKLLAHYRRCRSLRAKEAGQPGGRRDSAGHNCLVCSLVARQARTLLVRPSVSPSKNKSRGTSLSLKSKSSPQSSQMAPPPPRRRFLSTSKKVGNACCVSSVPLGSNTTLVSSLSTDLLRSQTSSGSKKSISFSLPPSDQDAGNGRPRSVSDVAAFSRDIVGQQRARSSSVGTPTTPSCDTIEEEVLSEGSGEDVEQLHFNIDLSR